ncbi:MAG: ABC transporter ATP-binding protein [Proteobacteria bacterium]|nr:ABC transporter ATP-binding protein [Pseudomonadota bacterium]
MNAQEEEKPAPVLELDRVSKSFGGVRAAQEVSFSVASGHIHALIGPNGAGKTTLFNLITGIYPADDGSVLFEGRDVGRLEVYERVAAGIARTFQNVELFTGMSVLENVMVGLHVRTRCGFFGALAKWPWVRREEEQARGTALDWLKFVGLEKMAESQAGDLPFGWQRLVEIARALASRPRLLLLDEPAAGLNARETRDLGVLLRQIRTRGVTLLLVEHDMSLTMEISDRIVVLDQGRKIAEGTPREIQADEKVLAAYLGQGE